MRMMSPALMTAGSAEIATAARRMPAAGSPFQGKHDTMAEGIENDARLPLALIGGTLIDGSGAPPRPGAVLLIQDGRIAEVAQGTMDLPEHTRKIDVSGRYIIPGLMDANVHLFVCVTPAELIRYEGQYEALIEEAAQIALRNGLTTVFDTWGPRAALTHVRDRINRGELLGSRIFFGGNIIGLGGPTSPDFFPQTRAVLSKAAADAIDIQWEQGVGADLLWMTPEEVRTRVRDYIETGTVDFLKYAGSGHAHMQFICFSGEVQRAIVEEGHRAGLTVQAHTTSPESLRMEIQAGADLLQHGDVTGPVRMPEETLALIADRQIPCAALLVTRRFLAWNDTHMCEPMRSANGYKDDNDRRLIVAGAPLLLTTDSGIFPATARDNPLLRYLASADDSHYVMGDAHLLWLQAAAELGMKPMEALMSATRNVARAYRVDKELGTLERGKIADLIVLDDNPLENPAHYRSIHLILKSGNLVDREALPRRRILTTATLSAQPMRAVAMEPRKHAL